MSWIHIRDQIGAIQHLLSHREVKGPVNLTAPGPVTNEEFSKTLASVLKRPALFRVPGFVLRLLLGEMAQALLLSGQRVIPRKLQKSGYEFEYPELRGALENLLG
jgi:NAD dependent epimerase/dehydratase family enzyme